MSIFAETRFKYPLGRALRPATLNAETSRDPIAFPTGHVGHLGNSSLGEISER